MRFYIRLFALLLLSLCLKLQAQPLLREQNAQFSINKPHLEKTGIQYGLEWITPTEFNHHPLKILDVDNVITPGLGRTQVVVAKLSFISHKRFENLSQSQLNQTEVVQAMFDATHVEKVQNIFKVWSTARAYGFNFQINYELKLQDISLLSEGEKVSKYFQSEIAAYGTSVRILKITMQNFSRLMDKNISYIAMTELQNGETFVIATVVSTLDSRNANLLFPFGRASKVMLSNMENQILSMSRNIQKL